MNVKMIGVSSSGSIAIEAALLVPLFLLFTFGILDFGYFFTQTQLAERSVIAISNAVSNNPQSSELSALARKHRQLIPLGSATSTLCAQAYSTLQEAEAGRCQGDTFNVSSPNAAVPEYYVALTSQVNRKTLTGFFDDELPPIESFNVVRVDLGVQNLIDQLTNELSKIRAALAESENRANERIADLERQLGETKNTKWGGSYQTYPAGECRIVNPKTGNCSCAPGTQPALLSEFINPGGISDFYCDVKRVGSTDCGYIAYQCS